jgi:hypothetical protein
MKSTQTPTTADEATQTYYKRNREARLAYQREYDAAHKAEKAKRMHKYRFIQGTANTGYGRSLGMRAIAQRKLNENSTR